MVTTCVLGVKLRRGAMNKTAVSSSTRKANATAWKSSKNMSLDPQAKNKVGLKCRLNQTDTRCLGSISLIL